ncbi:MAG: hypothetical protein LBE79_00980 [Tannerella sp.]|jgi:hypothetical protein|nr:hypothetical protein [Tannerella sp.]
MKFEEYIRNIRPKIDVEQPDEELIWIGISHSLAMHARQKRIRYWKYAFMVAAMIAIVFMAGYHTAKKSEPQLIFVNLDPKLAKQEAELVKLIGNYTRQIERENFNLETLSTTPADLEDIDRLIEAYSAYLKQYGANPELIETLLNLYETKIMLLNRMLNEIENEKEYENVKIIL